MRTMTLGGICLSGLAMKLAGNSVVAFPSPTQCHAGIRRSSGLAMAVSKPPPTSGGKPPVKSVYLVHERDFFRQSTRLASMDNYVLVSTLTASMSFGALLGFTPSAASKALVHIQSPSIWLLYKSVTLAIQVVSGLSTLCGLYATIIFSLTILYGKSALGAERDIEYDVFLKRTTRARQDGFRAFSVSLGLFCLDAVLLLVERMFFRFWSLPVFGVACYILHRL
jgi:hypothetical protein